ncbi:MAG TPA: hypothetical protein VMT46_10995 [Anaerolineaceae bacterium]|nr:hypothetical protein [Anaerolineaceae bacterium]
MYNRQPGCHSSIGWFVNCPLPYGPLPPRRWRAAISASWTVLIPILYLLAALIQRRVLPGPPPGWESFSAPSAWWDAISKSNPH